MDYKSFDIEDFMTDQSFLNYYLGANPADVKFWVEWLKINPEKAEIIAQAKYKLDIIYNKLPDNEYDEEYAKFKKNISLIKPYKNIDDTVIREMPGWRSYSRLVAGLSLLIVFSLLYYTWQSQNSTESLSESELPKSNMIEKYANKGQKNTIVLKDGSKIKLNSGSKIRFPENFEEDKREVFLEGEAYFEVEHNASQPFIVNSGGIRTKVLGTSFNIKNIESHNKVEIALVTGKVEIVKNASHEKVTLSPNELLEVDNETNDMSKRSFEPSKELGWKDGIIQFKEAKTDEITEVLENWYDTKIVIKNTPSNKGFTGEFDNESLETVLQGLSFSIGFNYKLEGNTVIIY
ncbi:FecR family protein [Chondrinema litorale]|uniref:FecR family protein n=1 Tax=Chondrinema litorale TaxID=2994555 RepID=UPI00254295E4|nr:FecR family protein [Chondrinema litorale]UZR96265.1 FecR family protein [Chondrinema litorale]